MGLNTEPCTSYALLDVILIFVVIILVCMVCFKPVNRTPVLLNLVQLNFKSIISKTKKKFRSL
jgi:hypothetical protein